MDGEVAPGKRLGCSPLCRKSNPATMRRDHFSCFLLTPVALSKHCPTSRSNTYLPHLFVYPCRTSHFAILTKVLYLPAYHKKQAATFRSGRSKGPFGDPSRKSCFDRGAKSQGLGIAHGLQRTRSSQPVWGLPSSSSMTTALTYGDDLDGLGLRRCQISGYTRCPLAAEAFGMQRKWGDLRFGRSNPSRR